MITIKGQISTGSACGLKCIYHCSQKRSSTIVLVLLVAEWWCICSAAIDAAEAHPDQNPPWAKNADDAVKDVVRAVVMDVHCAVALWLH